MPPVCRSKRIAANIRAHLKGVLAAGYGDVVGELKHVLDRKAGTAGGQFRELRGAAARARKLKSISGKPRTGNGKTPMLFFSANSAPCSLKLLDESFDRR